MLIYSWIGLSGASASRKRSWATMEAETDSSTAPLRQIIRSYFVHVNKIIRQQTREGERGRGGRGSQGASFIMCYPDGGYGCE